MTVSGAEKVVEAAGHSSGHKEKGEKRRALGRGLESLLPGPRVVSPAAAAPSAGTQQVPHRGVAPVRNDNVGGDLQGGVEETGSAAQAASVIQAPPFAQDAKDGAPSVSSSTLRTSLSGPDSASVHDASSALPGSPLLATDARSGAAFASGYSNGGGQPFRAALGWTAGGGCPHIQLACGGRHHFSFRDGGGADSFQYCCAYCFDCD